MSELGDRPCFSLEARQTIWILRPRWGKQLDRDVATQFRVAGAPTSPMPSAPSDEINR